MVALWPSPEAECLRRLLHARISLHATSQGVLVDMPVPVSHAGPVGPWPPEKMRTTKGIPALLKGLCIGNWSFHPPLDRCAMMGLVWVWVWGAGHKLLNLLFLHTPTISEKEWLVGSLRAQNCIWVKGLPGGGKGQNGIRWDDLR